MNQNHYGLFAFLIAPNERDDGLRATPFFASRKNHARFALKTRSKIIMVLVKMTFL